VWKEEERGEIMSLYNLKENFDHWEVSNGQVITSSVALRELQSYRNANIPPSKDTIDIAMKCINQIVKINKIHTACADCDDYRKCEDCGCYLDYEREVHRILEGVK
jgi:hypothetical protein